MRRVSVDLPGRAYDVIVGRGVVDAAASYLPQFPGAEKGFVVTDRRVGGMWWEPLADALRSRGLAPLHLWVPEGEAAKSLQVLDALYRQMAVQEAHRDDVVFGLGGGAVGDVAGLLAATYMRGMAVVQVPTTLTAQVDASVGGKTAVNLPEGKNLVGAYHQPAVVLTEIGALATLSERDLRSGLAEVAKYGLALDTGVLAVLEGDLSAVLEREPEVMEDLVARCVGAKAVVVAGDERDSGRRLLLNYGHTLGHALERLDSFSGRSHGEAIAVGMVFAARLSGSFGLGVEGLAARHARLLNSLGLDVTGPLPKAEEIMEAFRLDKKYRGGVRFVLLEDVGRPRVEAGVPEDLIRGTLEDMGAAS